MTANRLAHETSPYLLQHQHNPVHWMAWGQEALDLAQRSNRPILLSVGYAACHWCHVMAHESFENEQIAALMNEHFVNIKVDREERPDIDKIYMEALHRLGEQGGWPLTMFLTPQGEPFWGGTYFPPEERYGRPGFPTVLKEISRIFQQDADKIRHNADALISALNREIQPSESTLSLSALDQVASHYLNIVDMDDGGLKGAPKFPQVPMFSLLWRAYLRTGQADYRRAVETFLTHIAQGGIYDHLGGGFARYAVDHHWLVPHFEKMLYDNAALVELMCEVWQLTQDELLRVRIEETIAWVRREMIAESGAFAASLDADSEGREGKFYVWSESEIRAILGPDRADEFCRIYDVRPGGNWEGDTILNRLGNLQLEGASVERRLAEARELLLSHRSKRVRPGWDDKVLTDWNGLMISAMAFAGSVFDRNDWLAAAAQAYDVICEKMLVAGRLHHSLRSGRVQHLAVADDYANLIRAALSLYQALGNARYIEQAKTLTEGFNRSYWDEARGGYFFTSSEAEALIARQKTVLDDSTPNANATMIANLTRLAFVTGDDGYTRQADAIIDAFGSAAEGNVYSHAGFFNGLEDQLALIQAVIIATDFQAARALREALYSQSMPTRMILVAHSTEQLPAGHPAFGKKQIEGQPTLYICKGRYCSLPIIDPESIRAGINLHSRPSS